MKHAHCLVFALVLPPVLALSAACGDSPIGPARLEQIASDARAAGVPLSASPDAPDANASSAGALFLTEPTPQQATCTVELQKTEVFDKEKGKEGDWVAYDGSVLEIVPPEDLYLKYELKVNIPAKHYVNFRIEKSVLQPGTSFTYERIAEKWKPRSLVGELAGNQSLQLQFAIRKTIAIGNDQVDVQGHTFEITPGWECFSGFDEVSHGSLGTFKFTGVEKKKKKK